MSILQISRITVRKGLEEELPSSLTGAEFGWALDGRKLFIGNGTLTEGAPVIGNTEILTQHSNLFDLADSYTYEGTHGGYVVDTGGGSDLTRSMQDKFDEIVTVLDFGAVGDDLTDDTAAINRALFELFCVQVNDEVKRALHIPAGKYLISGPIKIPPNAKIYGDGISSTIFRYNTGGVSVDDHVIIMSDDKHQVDTAIGTGSASVTPTGVEMSSLSVISEEANGILLLDSITKSSFKLMELQGINTIVELSVPPLPASEPLSGATSAIEVVSNNSIMPRDITISQCITGGTTYGLRVDQQCKGLTFEKGRIDTHYKGVKIGTEPFPSSGAGYPPSITGVNVTRTVFDNIGLHGISIGDIAGALSSIRMNSSAFNVFYNVGNNFGVVAASSIINITNDGNVSIGDLFERTDAVDETDPRIVLNGKASVAFDSSSGLKLGSYKRTTGIRTSIADNASSTLFSLVPNIGSVNNAIKIDYTISRQNDIRQGTISATNNIANGLSYVDDFTESGDTGISLWVTQVGASPVDIQLSFTSSATGSDARFQYSVERLD